MAAIKLLAVLSLDGYMVEASDANPDGHSSLLNDITAVKSQSDFLLDENSSITLIREWKKNDSPLTAYLMEANRKTVSLLNCMMRMRLFDEIILYVSPEFIGRGQRLFQPDMPGLQWSFIEMKHCGNSVVRLTYSLRKDDKQTAMFSF